MRDRNQVVLPLNLEICIPEGDFVFKVAEICEELDYTELFNTYARNWRKVNPITLFEIIVYGYMKRKYSGREIAEACKTDIRFMWLLNGEPAPSHATISRFEDERLSGVIEGLFYQFVEKLYEMGEVKFKNLFVDGTKIEAYANKYTFVWKSAVEKNLAKLEKKISALLSVLSERYGFSEDVSLEECYEQLLRQAQWVNLVFAFGKGKHKTQLLFWHSRSVTNTARAASEGSHTAGTNKPRGRERPRYLRREEYEAQIRTTRNDEKKCPPSSISLSNSAKRG